uniref:Uncharacterized protein n=1 Tax=Pristhesancus plagipennis TaxID=1955184 RepID=A0A2K8JST7_PRIPG|nr:secreted hypothetical protein [Pristhesancus plagipennis]
MVSIYFTTLITALLLISSTQAKQFEEKAVVEELQNWAKEKLLGGIDDLKKAEQDLKNIVKEAIDESRQELEAEYANAVVEYHTHKERLHPKCFQQGLTYLTSYEPIDLPNTNELFIITANIGNTTTPKPPNCVTEAIKDVGLMLYAVVKYIGSILNTMDDVINGYTLCSQGAWWKKFTCLFTYVSTAISDVYHTLTGVGQLVRDLTKLGADMKQQISNCTNPKKIEIRQQILLALDNADKCTKMYR